MKGLIEKPLILASSSERRIFLLKETGVHFIAASHKIQIEPEFNKSLKNISIGDFVENLALKKAQSLGNDYPENFILGSDTLIYQNGTVYGKPKDAGGAFDMLKELSGKTHCVYTGIGLFNKQKNISMTECDITAVRVRALNDNEIMDYIRKYPPLDKAGGYGIQDEEGIVESYEGSFENVLGLPVQKLIPILNKYRLH